jgi:phospholipase D1/2
MATERYSAYIAPNVVRFGEPILIKVNHAPVAAAGPVQLKLYEMNDYSWVDPDDPKKSHAWDEENPESGEGRGDDLLASWTGEIKWAKVTRDGASVVEPRFVPTAAPWVAYQGEGQATMFSATSIPVQLEGVRGTYRIPLALERKRNYEGDTLELGLRIDRGNDTLFMGTYATLVRDWRWWAKRSFAPPRAGNQVRYFTNGRDYWADLADALMSAKRTIYITGWALQPHNKLRRPRDNNQTLAAFLADAGNRGVKVRVLITDTAVGPMQLYKSKALNNWDEVAQAWLMAHPGIEVSRHRPNPHLWEKTELREAADSPFWTHHQKTVMIDGELAFVGGIDLASGRWDTDACALDDPLALETPTHGDLNSNETFKHRETERGTRPRMPWQDIHARVEGPSAWDVVRNFTERWNKAAAFQRDSLQQRLDGIQQLEADSAELGRKLRTINHRLEDLVPGNGGQPAAARIAALQQWLAVPANFDHALGTAKDSDVDYELKVMAYTALYTWRFDTFAWKMLFEPMGILFQESYGVRAQHSWSGFLAALLEPARRDALLRPAGAPPLDSPAEAFEIIALLPEPAAVQGGATVQVVRSVDKSSLPDDAVARMKARTGNSYERSILDTYGIAINLAQHYIYIETQMFISHDNKLGDLLYEKIAAKMRAKVLFHVYMIVPEVYDGDPADGSAREVNFFQWQSIKSLRERLGKVAGPLGLEVDDYVQVFCLRTLGAIDFTRIDPITKRASPARTARVNLVYVHSKLMIVDDMFVTVGSANLNQRSLMGDRDSEINVNVLDDDELTIDVGDPRSKDRRTQLRKLTVRRTAHELRMHLWRKHLGVDPSQEPGTDVTIQNPTHPATIKLWRDRARLNRSLTSGVFNRYYGAATSEKPGAPGASTPERDPPERLVQDMYARGLRGFVTLFGLEPTAGGESSWYRPDFLTE